MWPVTQSHITPDLLHSRPLVDLVHDVMNLTEAAAEELEALGAIYGEDIEVGAAVPVITSIDFPAHYPPQTLR